MTDNDSTLPIPAADNTGLYSPAALHRKLRGELARYDTYSLSLEHVNTLQHTQQHADAQQDTVAIASALRVSHIRCYITVTYAATYAATYAPTYAATYAAT